MKQPTNFEKIRNHTFKHNGIEYRLNIRTEIKDTTEMWLIPFDMYKKAFRHVMLFTIDWNKGMVFFKFPKMGAGIKSCLPSTPDHIIPIRTNDIASMDNFIEWCRHCVDKFINNIKK